MKLPGKLGKVFPFLILVPGIILIVLVTLFYGFLSLNFWLALVIGLGLPAVFLYLYQRARRKDEIVKCANCGRTMMYGVFQKSGACPKCHTGSYLRTGTWPDRKTNVS